MIDRRILNNDSLHAGADETYSLKLLWEFGELLDRLGGCFAQNRTAQRAKLLAKALLCSDPPHTITSMLISAGLEQQDWTESYALFSKARWKASDVFDVVLGSAQDLCADSRFYAAMDEVHLPKSGRKIPGAMTLRNPLGLHFANPLHRAQRWLNTVCLIPTCAGISGPARGVPVDFRHVPPAKKPGKRATEEERSRYKEEAAQKSISACGREAIYDLRWNLDKIGGKERLLMMSVDGSFTNSTVLRDLPERTVVVGRAAKNIVLFKMPEPYPGKGRRRKYGERIGTPEDIRHNQSISWQETRIWIAGKKRKVEYKTLSPLLWQGGTKDMPLRLIVIRALPYRLSKNRKKSYREPVYLLVSEPAVSVEEILACYFHRWEIEVNHRDMKSIIGVGEAQVRNTNSAVRAPQFVAVVYSMLLLASLKAYGPSRNDVYGPTAKWRNDKRPRPSTLDILRRYRRELYQAGIESFRPLVSADMAKQVAKNSLCPQATCKEKGGYT